MVSFLEVINDKNNEVIGVIKLSKKEQDIILKNEKNEQKDFNILKKINSLLKSLHVPKANMYYVLNSSNKKLYSHYYEDFYFYHKNKIYLELEDYLKNDYINVFIRNVGEEKITLTLKERNYILGHQKMDFEDFYNGILLKINKLLKSMNLPKVHYFHYFDSLNKVYDLANDGMIEDLWRGVYVYNNLCDNVLTSYKDEREISSNIQIKSETEERNGEIFNMFNITIDKGDSIEKIKVDYEDAKNLFLSLEEIFNRYSIQDYNLNYYPF